MGRTSHDFAGRCLLLTGAAGGIGRAVARLFHEAGADLLLADRDTAALESLASTLGDARRVELMRLDAASGSDAEEAVARCVRCFGGLDFLVPAAGVYPDNSVATMRDEAWRAVMEVNLDGVFRLCRSAIPALRENSAIVLLSSVAGHRGSRDHAHYAAAKAGLIGFARSLAWELGPRTRVNAVSPGIIETAMTEGLREARGEALRAQTPLGRHGKAEEVAGVVAFLCSDAAGFVNGEAIQVNGGLHMA
ncbi:SDR family oxidoreductase [Sabulicella glaciei]|uniref:SDR family oxidoreductase n=1 Tax=Sabulicella glaciei TaxID=2984948 RepID=A0ABT3NPZ8_9PROT|nr:SDR family NAD(P)-dependent oxidoreductase [Roseococcus sp. MDT2-1-1]MCW8084236.1 SDR family oxidoreductase [Roseococcus sp. MDT2-1-1]